MIFRRNKPATPSAGKTPVLRGRDSAEHSDNPLARRFHPEDEPDTIDLQQPAGFTDEPGTADLAEKSSGKSSVKSTADSHVGIVSMAPDTDGMVTPSWSAIALTRGVRPSPSISKIVLRYISILGVRASLNSCTFRSFVAEKRTFVSHNSVRTHSRQPGIRPA